MKFRKKQIIVEAERWFPGKHVDGVIEPDQHSVTQFAPFVNTVKGPVMVAPGDWIVTEACGARYSIKPDVFEKMFEPAPEVRIQFRKS